MKAKWYLSALVLILALLGFNQPQVYLPNQEIVVQFTNDEVSLDEAENAVAIVKKQLQDIGVDKIQVRESIDGKLKITYYSDLDVTSIKKIFSQEKNAAFDYTLFDNDAGGASFPSEENSNSYKLNVCEIKSGTDLASDFNGYLINLGLDNDRLFKPTIYPSIDKNEIKESNKVEKTAYALHKRIALAIDNSSRKIPEVRAGPALNRSLFSA